MEIVACMGCGKLFNHISGIRVCQACQRKLDEKFMEVKKYVREHPDIDVKTLSEEMEVSVNQIHRWVRQERLVFSDDSPIGLPCESCGVTIKSGRYCEPCKAKMTEGFRDAAGLNKKAASASPRRGSAESKMRFLDQ